MFATGEALAVQLFFWTITITALALFATQAGWNHRLFLFGLLGLAIVSFVLGVFWGKITVTIPQISKSLTDAVTSGFAWMGLLMLGLGSILISERAFRRAWLDLQSNGRSYPGSFDDGLESEKEIGEWVTEVEKELDKQNEQNDAKSEKRELDLIPVLEAAQAAYELTKDGSFAHSLRVEGKDIIMEYADLFRVIGLLYGAIPPSQTLVKIAHKVGTSLKLSKSESKVIAESKHKDKGNLIFDSISVERGAIQKVVNHLNR